MTLSNRLTRVGPMTPRGTRVHQLSSNQKCCRLHYPSVASWGISQNCCGSTHLLSALGTSPYYPATRHFSKNHCLLQHQKSQAANSTTEDEEQIRHMREAFELFESAKKSSSPQQKGQDTTKKSSSREDVNLKRSILEQTGLLPETDYSEYFRKPSKEPSKRKQRADMWREKQALRKTEDQKRKMQQHQTAPGKKYHHMMPELSHIAPRDSQTNTVEAVPYRDDFIQPNHPHLLKVAIMGNPNAGKSTFLNTLLNQRVSAVSSKICTTRENTQSIFTEDNCQIVFYDTPGIIESGDTQAFSVDNELIADAKHTLDKADLVLLMIDSTRDLSLINHIIRDIRTYMLNHDQDDQYLSQGIVAVLNKKDLVYPKTLLQEKYVELEKSGIFTNIFFVCAENGHGISNVKDFLKKISIPSEWMFPRHQVSALNRDEIIRETIREKLFTSLNEDIPYGLHVQFRPVDRRRIAQIIPDNLAQQEAVYEQKRHLIFFDKPETGKKYVEIHVDIFCPSSYAIQVVKRRLKKIHPKVLKALRGNFPKREIVMKILVKLKDRERTETVMSTRRLKRLRKKRMYRNEQ